MTKEKSRPLAASSVSTPAGGVRTGLRVEDLKQSFVDNLLCSLGRIPAAATPNDAYTALALTARDRVLKQSVRTMEAHWQRDARVVAYLSAEFLPGPHLANNLLNLGIVATTSTAWPNSTPTQCGPHGQVFLRPFDPRLLRARVEGPTGICSCPCLNTKPRSSPPSGRPQTHLRCWSGSSAPD